jgi:hypothetical protein
MSAFIGVRNAEIDRRLIDKFIADSSLIHSRFIAAYYAEECSRDERGPYGEDVGNRPQTKKYAICVMCRQGVTVTIKHVDRQAHRGTRLARGHGSPRQERRRREVRIHRAAQEGIETGPYTIQRKAEFYKNLCQGYCVGHGFGVIM